ncbi:hypothetical protein BDV25DRAFT_154812 [Aspergillus avenaceus]|uniref:Uncharacterized protein n=1 Tax=Aspergillus avenaceus TaxID=36643 RepID=A0A5N6TV23_ASPAV|nr:hypothetical protein BDV25DRAFT_154812 [Aspergillus avenaceus]
MSSTDQHMGLSETHKTILLPGNLTQSDSNTHHRDMLQRACTFDQATRNYGEAWKPTIDRRQSWNEEDRKHEQLRSWLSDVEKGEETGFTECSQAVD